MKSKFLDLSLTGGAQPKRAGGLQSDPSCQRNLTSSSGRIQSFWIMIDTRQRDLAPVREDGPRRIAILVCGMHRCGTSALTRVLNLMGAALPENVVPAALGNERGHWEPKEAVSLHDEMLHMMRTGVNALENGDDDWLISSASRQFKDRIKSIVVDEYANHPLFVVKDPRLSLLLPLWIAALNELDIAHRVILSFRTPLEVAESLRQRQTAYYPSEFWPVDRGGLLWLRYITAAELHSRGSKRAFCNFSDLLDDWRATIRRLGSQLELEWPRGAPSVEDEVEKFLDNGLRHQVAGTPLALLGRAWAEWIEPIYEELERAKASGEIDQILFDRVASAYRTSVQYLGGYLAALDTHAGLSSVEASTRLIDAKTAEVGALRTEASELLTQIDAMRSRTSDMETELSTCRAELAVAVATINLIYSSRSWRVTEPLRTLARLFVKR
jgi:hypothetical protein